MITLDSIRRPVERELEAFDAFVERNIRAEGELLSEMLRYALSSRGKGIRPIVVMLSAALHSPEGRVVALERSCLAAMLVEMIHVASLIHDDVIDEADTRRGKPSVNARWQSHRAVLLGDYILAKNLGVGMASGEFDLVSHVCAAMATLCEGEALQSDCAGRRGATRGEYFDIINKKTASLIAVSASAGAMAAGAPAEAVERMRRYGEALGTAFQIQDDILDYTRSARTGKPANNDLREGKVTLPLLPLLEEADAARRDELLDRLARCADDERSVDYLQQAVERGGGLAAAAATMGEYVARARAQLAPYPPSPVRAALDALCSYVAERDR